MVVVLSVAEKPSVAKELATIIGKGSAQRRNGRSPYNHVYDIQNCEFNGGYADMKMTSVLGHMMEMEFRGEYKKWNGCNPEDLFTAPIDKTVKKDMENVARTLSEEARKCDTLLLWLDCDLEGENIAFEVVKVCTEANPRLAVYRARFSALIPRDVLATLRAPQRPNKHMSEAVDARQEIDLRLGAAFTRFQTLRLQSKYAHLSKIVLSYGPCQFPTLGFVVERYLKRQKFVPEDYWYISCEVQGADPDEASGTLTCSFSWKRGIVYDRASCIMLYQLCVEAARAKVIQCSARCTFNYKPLPLNTIELQMRASRYLRISSDDTMTAAESLYQKGILSYPRTETDFFKEGFELIPLIQEHCAHPEWGQFCQNILNNNGFEHPKNGGHDDQAHPPIHPTKSVHLGEIQDPKERKIYELVTRHFLACCAKDAKGDQTTVQIQFDSALDGANYPNLGKVDVNTKNMSPIVISDQKEIADVISDSGVAGEVFEATGLMIRERNWLDVYRYEKWYANKIPSVRVGDVVKPKRLEMTEGRTVAPFPISESELISQMDANGIGTDATIATHIKTIQDRKYAERDNESRFVPTDLGIALVEGYNNMGYQLNKPYLRAAMEKDCVKVSKGELSRSEMVDNCLRQMKECFRTCRRDVGKLEEAIEKYMGAAAAQRTNEVPMRVVSRHLSKCGLCENMMSLNISGQQGEQDCRRVLVCGPCNRSYILPMRGEIIPHSHLCPICNFQVLSIRNAETGRSYTTCPMCFKNPPGPPDSEEGASEMHCFSCAHACLLAGMVQGGNSKISPCYEPSCIEGEMKLKKNDKGYIIGCTKYPGCRATWWLPKFIKSATVDMSGESCGRCKEKSGVSVLKINIMVNLSMAPPGTPPELQVCPACDRLWRDANCEPLKLPISGISSGYNVSSTRSAIGSASRYLEPQGTPYRAPQVEDSGKGFQLQSGAGSMSASTAVSAPGASYIPWKSGSTTSTNYPVSSSTSDYGAAAVGGDRYKASTRGGRGAARGGRGSGRGSSAHSGDGDSNNPECLCGEKSVSRTVSKEGPNKGRQFRVCPKPRGEGCNFFEWAEDSQAIGAASSGGFSSGGSFRGRPGPPAGGVICTKCKEPGHYARQCSRNY